MARLKAALVREQGVTFAVAMVRNHVVLCQQQSAEAMRAVSVALGCPLVVLMGETNQRLRGNRADVVRFVESVHPARLPWRTWTV